MRKDEGSIFTVYKCPSLNDLFSVVPEGQYGHYINVNMYPSGLSLIEDTVLYSRFNICDRFKQRITYLADG